MINTRMFGIMVTLVVCVGISQSHNIQRHLRGISEYTDENGHRVLVRRNHPKTVNRPSRCECQCYNEPADAWYCCDCDWSESTCFPATARVKLQNYDGVVMKDLKSDGDGDQEDLQRFRRCRCMCYSNVYQDGWYCCECGWTDSACFPATAKVTRQGQGPVAMRDLLIGDRVLTADSDGQLVYSEVRAFLKRSPHTLSTYLKISTTDGAAVRLSDSHVIFMAAGNSTEMVSRFAKDISIGDSVYVGRNGSLAPVEVNNIEFLDMEGVYVPLTDHGTVIVDDVYTSCYASFDHSLAHAFLAPLRWWPRVFGSNGNEADGMPTFVYLVKTIGRWVLPGGWQDRSHWSSGLGHMFS